MALFKIFCGLALGGIVLLGCPVLAQTGTAGPSFSCLRAEEGTVGEMIICRDPALSRQDRVLATAFSRARTVVRGSEGHGELLASQQAWLRGREDCVNLRTQKSYCVSSLTEKRIVFLNQWATTGTNPDRAAVRPAVARPQKTGTIAGSRPPSGPSFNCARASNGIERLICADRSLSILDREMAGLYARASYLLAPDMAALLSTEQRSFLSNRNLCARRTNDKTACVQTAYEMRNLRLNEWVSNRSAD